MRAPEERFDLVCEFLNLVFNEDLHAKRVPRLWPQGTLGVMSGAACSVS